MAETAARSVAVVLKADVQDYVSKMGVASKATKDFAAQAGRTAGSAAKSTKDLGTAAAQSSTGLDSATKSTKAFGDQTRKTQQDIEKTKKSTQDAGAAASQIGTGMAVAGAALAAGIGVAVKAFADFDKEMSNVAAVSNATAGEMQQLTDAALAAGAATKFSASDAAAAEAELAKAGISTRDILGGALKGSLDLAAAGNLNLADAASYAANAMNIFDLKGQDVGHVADLLASAASKADGEVSDFGAALSQSGLVAAQVGLSLEDTTGVLAAFADNALKGSDGGTSLKTMLQRLVPQSKEASEAMKDIGFSAYDAQGAFIGIDKVAEQLQKGLSGLTQKQRDTTLATIFGSDAVRAANVLYKIGGQGVRDYTTAVNDQGAAARIAAKQMDNLSGDLENLRGSFETALIKGGSGANDALRGLTKSVTGLVNGFSELPPSVQSGVVEIAALTAGTLLLGGGMLSVIPKIVATRAAIEALAASSTRAAAVMSALSGANLAKAGLVVGLAAAAAEINNVAAEARVAKPPVENLAKGLAEIGEGATASKDFGTIFARGMGPFARTFEDANDALADFGANAKFALDHNFIEGVFGNAAEAGTVFESRIKQIDSALVKLVQGGRADEAAAAVDRLERSAQDAGLAAGRVTDQLTGYKGATESAAIANGKYADSTDGIASAASGALGPGRLLSDEINDQKKAAEDAQKAYDDLTKSVEDYGNQVATALSASAGYEAAIDAAADIAKRRDDLQKQINDLTAAGGAKGEINTGFDKADAKLQADYAERIKKATDEAEKSRLRTELAERLSDSKGDRKKALDDNLAQIARLKEQQAQYAKTLDVSTEAGRNNQKLLIDIATNAKNAAVENFKNGQSVDEVKGKFLDSRQAFIDQAVAFGDTEAHAKTLADKLGLTEQNLDTLRKAPPAEVTVNAQTEAANRAIADTGALLDATDGRTATATVDVNNVPAAEGIGDISYLLDATDTRVATATITADAAKALTDASTFDDLMGQIDGKTANATVNLAVETSGPNQSIFATGDLSAMGFSGGGYTGDAPKYQPVGVVHGGEFVFTKEETANAGVVNLRALARSLRGYDRGGYVTPQFADRGMVSSAVSNTYGGSVSNDNRAYIDKVYGLTLDQVQRDTDRRSRLHRLGRRGA